MSQPTIESVLQEKRLFEPSAEFSQSAHIKSLAEYQQIYDRAKADPATFWAELADQELHWFEKWHTVLDWQPPSVKWFDGGKINISYNCLDRHLTTWRKNKAALIWEGENGDSRTLTYSQLHHEVCQFANALKQLGVQKGDRVGIYMPMIPEAAIAMLACARIGAVHGVVFGGFSAEALRDRLVDAEAKLVITADGGWRKDAIVPLKEQVDKAIANGAVPSVTDVLVVKRTGQNTHMTAGRDHWWHDLATTLMYEGAPRPSNLGCFWDVIEKYQVSVFYTAPTAIRAFIKMGEHHPNTRDLTSLRLLGTVGEPINPEAWMWYHRVIGGSRCPIVDTWWQTETGGVMITALPGAVPTKPGSATLPFPGIIPDIVDLEGNPANENEGGYLIVRHPWPGMMRTVYGDPERFRKSYWEHIPPKDGNYVYFAGDGARKDEDGYYWVMGRVDDVINVAGHRLGTMEIESALVSHPAVAEAAVVGKPDELKGEDIFAFVILEGDRQPSDELAKELKKHVVGEIGAIARPNEIRFAEALPKTRSGKIMRRLLRSLASGQEITSDTSTLEDRSILDKLREGA